ncbi:MAG: class I SAM-dependent methyltransferase [Gammaproteobacteria bacterium]|nr:MAG: class I SAM-dependent methyltransferase [Gammaproteobacteria bacterium]
MSNQSTYWDSVAEKKEFTHPFNFANFEIIAPKKANILDYGCGYGRIMNELYTAGYQHLVGLDFSTQLIARGQRLFPYIGKLV